MFQENEIFFYQLIKNNNEEIVGNGIPTTTDIEEFWSGIWNNLLTHNENANWIQDEIETMRDTEEMKFDGITKNELRYTIRNKHYWKAPGNDNI